MITENGTLVFYDSITGSTTQNSWMASYDMDQKDIYELISGYRQTCIMPTKKAAVFANEDNYLFHIGHRIVDYNRQNIQTAVIIMSIDEELLDGVCNGRLDTEHSFNYIVDREGNVISHPDKTMLDGKAAEAELSGDEAGMLSDQIYDGETGWTITSVVDQNRTLERLHTQQSLIMAVFAAVIAVLVFLIRYFIRDLTGSVNQVVSAMHEAERGNVHSRITVDGKMPEEVETIARQYNSMMDRILESSEKEKELSAQKQKAEIAALEAQINPHFLYNILDTINWIAIGRKEFEISRAITALASILRYGIDNSNGIVTVRDEYEWLKQYLLLQQTRLKEGFESRISIQPEAMDVRIHKLLIQPFVENAIVHGFDGISRKPVLGVEIRVYGDTGLDIEISDNGKGIPPSELERFNRGVMPETSKKGHIGMKNALERMQMYYGARAEVRIQSEEGVYTKVTIRIPDTEGGEG